MEAAKKGLETHLAPFMRAHGPWIAALFVLVFVVFGDVLLSLGPEVLGNRGTDVFMQFISWREFGFGELRKGNLPLWNPHIFSGAPYFGGFQAALLYPPNWIFFVLPVAPALNWSVAIDTFLLGLFMYLWAAQRQLRPASCFLAACLIMFGGTHFLHIYAGHLTNLSAMTWAPLIFLAIDGFFVTLKCRYLVIGMIAVAMQIFAGHPQYTFYTAIAAAIYSMLRLITCENRGRIAAGLLAIYPAGAALAAVQLLPGIQASSETIRSQPLPYAFAAMFGFPPENLLTLIAPAFFGTMSSVAYWGRAYLWEMSLFISVTGVLLACIGAMCGRTGAKWTFLVMILITFLLALGAYTPLFAVLYNVVPGFDKFRSISKFIFQCSLFLVMLAAIGYDHLLSERQRSKTSFVVGLAIAAAIASVAALYVQSLQPGAWRGFVQHVHHPLESYLPRAATEDMRFLSSAQELAVRSLWIAAATMSVAAGLLAAARRHVYAVYGLLGLSVAEITLFVWTFRDTFDSRIVAPPEFKKFLAANPGDYRILNPLHPNSAMSTGAKDLWGFDPGVVRRYAEFMTFSQGGNPDRAMQYVSFNQLSPLYTMLRLRYAFIVSGNQVRVIPQATPMHRLELIGNYRVLENRDAILRTMADPFFDPRREVILEKNPSPIPENNTGKAWITDSSTDHLTIEAELEAPSLLLITDVYTDAWNAESLDGSVQDVYELQPANYTLQAIPLRAGHHRMRVEYKPFAFTAGKWVSTLAWLLLAAALLVPRLKFTWARRAWS
jgi:hypothetical protein